MRIRVDVRSGLATLQLYQYQDQYQYQHQCQCQSRVRPVSRHDEVRGQIVRSLL